MPLKANPTRSDKSFQQYDLNDLRPNMRLEVGVAGGGSLVVTTFDGARNLIVDDEECLSEIWVWDTTSTFSFDTKFVRHINARRHIKVGPNQFWRYGERFMSNEVTMIHEVDPLDLQSAYMRARQSQ